LITLFTKNEIKKGDSCTSSFDYRFVVSKVNIRSNEEAPKMFTDMAADIPVK